MPVSREPYLLPAGESDVSLAPRMARQYTLHRPQAVAASGIDYVAALNAEQYEAVSSPPGKALVIAGAGSGKTRTLTYRVAWLLDHGTESKQVLLLTFTNILALMIGESLTTRILNSAWDIDPQDTVDKEINNA